jgi:hypothetical protein
MEVADVGKAQHKSGGYIQVASGSSRKRERCVYLQRKAILAHAKMSGMRVVRSFADHECIEDNELCQGLSDALVYIERQGRRADGREPRPDQFVDK